MTNVAWDGGALWDRPDDYERNTPAYPHEQSELAKFHKSPWPVSNGLVARADAEGERSDPLERSARAGGLDRLRGLAVMLMVLDHVWLVFVSADVHSGGRALGRLAMPLFALTVGGLADKPLSWRRRAMWLGAYIVAAPLYVLAGIGGAEMLLLLALGRFLAASGAGGIVMVVAALTMAANGEVTLVAGNFDPFAVMGLVCLGAGVGADRLAASGDRLPRALERVGRWPLLVYVGHLAVLAGVGVAT